MAIRSLKNGTFSRSLLVGNTAYVPPLNVLVIAGGAGGGGYGSTASNSNGGSGVVIIRYVA